VARGVGNDAMHEDTYTDALVCDIRFPHRSFRSLAPCNASREMHLPNHSAKSSYSC
jgi:hypothetical protein